MIYLFVHLTQPTMAQRGENEYAEQLTKPRSLLAQNKFKEAAEILDKIIKQSPKFAEAYFMRARVYRFWLDESKPKTSYPDYEKAIELAPYWERAYIYYSYSLRSDGLQDRAKAIIQKGLQVMPKSAELFFELGNIAQDQDNDEQAIRDYTQAIALEKKRKSPVVNRLTQYYYFRSDLWLKQKNYEQTLLDLNAMIAVDPDDHDNYNTLASYYINNFEDYAQALPNYEKALSLATKLQDIERYKERIAYCKDRMAYSYYKTGDSLVDQQQYAEAIEWAHKALALATPGEQTARWSQQLLEEATQGLQKQQSIDSLRQATLAVYEEGVALFKKKNYSAGLKKMAEVEALHQQHGFVLKPLRYMHDEILRYRAQWRKIRDEKFLRDVKQGKYKPINQKKDNQKKDNKKED